MLKKYLIGTFAVAMFAFAATASAYDFGTTTLKVGSKGEAVKTLQTLVGATADGNFGPMTAAKVKVWQAANGLTADGVFGNMSKAKANSMSMGGGSTTGTTCPTGYVATTPVAPLFASCVAAAGTPTTPTTPTGLAGVSGEITTITQISSYSNEEVGAGQKDIKVMGFDVDTSKDGDVAVKSIKLTFDASQNGSTDSDRLTDYLTAVHVYAGSTKVGTANTADFSKDSTGVYSKTILLDNAVVKADSTVKMYVSVDVISNLDSGDIDSDSWTVGINNIRYVDGGGVTTTVESDLATGIDYDHAGDGVAISFVSFAAAADTELKVSVATDTPAVGISTVKTTADTAKVSLLSGKFKVEGTSNVWLDEVPFLFTTNATNVDDITPTVYLTIDGTEYSESMTATAGTTEAITFDNLDKTLTAGQTYTFTVKADVNDIETSYFDEGDYLKAELDATRRALIIAENTEGDQLADSTEMTGTSTGNIQYFYSIAPKVEVVSSSISPNSNGTASAVSATAKMKLKITAQGGTIYLNGDDEATQSKEFFGIAVDGGDASTSIGATAYSFTTSGTYTTTNASADNEYYTLADGDTMYVDIEAVVVEATGSSAILVGMKGDEILFGTVETSDTTRAANTLNFSSLTDILKTGKTTLDS